MKAGMEIPKLLLDDTRQYRVMFESTTAVDDYSGKYVTGKRTYQLGNKLGSGAYSNVYTCRDVESGCIYAAKQYFKEEEPQEVDILRRVNRISHFGITRLIDAFKFEGKHYLVYDLASGCSLESLLKICKSKTDYIPVVPVELMKTLLRQLLVTCRFVHKIGVSHYDIKMDNIYILDHSRLMLIDFGYAYVCYCDDYMESAKLLGNIAFMPPEVLLSTYVVGASFEDQANIYMSVQTQQQIYTYLRYMHIPLMQQQQQQQDYLKQLTLSKYHHIRTLFDVQRHSLNAASSRTHTQVWIAAIKRLFYFIPLGNVQTPRGGTDMSSYFSILGYNKSFVGYKFAPCDSYPTEHDIYQISVQLRCQQLTKQQLHVFNKKLAIDSWSVGMIALILLLGEYPFRGLQQYETVPAIQLLSEAIKNQLHRTLGNIVVNGDFSLYEQYILKNYNIYYQIAEGPLPSNIPTDLFLLIAGLLYPNPQGRLSITECLGCPFIGAYQTYQEEDGAPLEKVLVPSEQFEKINESMSRIDRLRSSVTIRSGDAQFEEGNAMLPESDSGQMVEPSGDEYDDEY